MKGREGAMKGRRGGQVGRGGDVGVTASKWIRSNVLFITF